MRITKAYLQNIINEEMRSLKNSSTEPLDQMSPGGAFFEIVKGYLVNMDSTAIDFCQTLQSSGDLFEGLVETIATFNLDPQSGDHIIKAHDQIFGPRLTKNGSPPKLSGGFDQSAVNDLTQHLREVKNPLREETFGTGYYKRNDDEEDEEDEKPSPMHPKALEQGLAEEEEEEDPLEKLFDKETVNHIWELVNSSRVGSQGDLLNLALHKAGLDDHGQRLDIIKYYFPEEFYAGDESDATGVVETKITKSHIAKIINEEISNVLREGYDPIKLLIDEFENALEDIADHGQCKDNDIGYVINNWSDEKEKAWLETNKGKLLDHFC